MSETNYTDVESGKQPKDSTVMHILYGMHTVAPFTFWTLAVIALVVNYIKRSDRQICSQMADDFLTNGAGYHVFCDGRLSQDVVPSEFYYELQELPGNRTIIVDPTREGTYSPIVSDEV